MNRTKAPIASIKIQNPRRALLFTLLFSPLIFANMNVDNFISERSSIIASYALCGFANFASIGIQLGGIGGIAPNRMGDLADLALRAMVAGSIADVGGCVRRQIVTPIEVI